jgi:hypothetical protein
MSEVYGELGSITNPVPWYETEDWEGSKIPGMMSWQDIALLYGEMEESPTLTAGTALAPETRIRITLEKAAQGPGASEALSRLIGKYSLSLHEATSSDRTDVSNFPLGWSGWSHYAALSVPFEAITQLAVEKFSAIPEVEAIYRDRVNNRLSFWVFTNNDKYDDALMDILIAKEEEILDAYPQFVTSISFPPSVLCENHREVVGNTATAIFER